MSWTLDHEVAQLAALEVRLVRERPEVGVERIHTLVWAAVETFDDAPLRDFVPLLVERIVRHELSHPPDHRAA